MSPPAPATSVLLPARDAEGTLRAALESVLAQSDPDWELLLVDDGSRDGTGLIARDAAAGDARVRVLAGEGRGLVAALELARREARGRFLLRMDADDLAHERRLELLRALLEADERVACASSLVESFATGGRVALGRRQYDAWLNAHFSHEAMARVRFVESPVAHPSVLLRADAVARAGGYREEGGPEDWDLWLRLFQEGHRFAKVPRTLLRWREGPGRLSRVDARYSRAGFMRVRALHLARFLGERPALLAGAGRQGGELARALRARGATVSGFVDVAPRRIGGTKAGVRVFSLADLPRIRGDALVIGVAGGRGARASLRNALVGAGLEEGVDFFLAA
ncbi:glycosyltransferase [bacterium]|nr:glycosyltransferase [bacterium]